MPATSSSGFRRVGDLLRTESVGGALLLGAAALAVGWANSPWAAGYHRLVDYRPVGPGSVWHGPAGLSLGSWAADGLLAIFFFVAGLELKRAFVSGHRRGAALPVAAAVGGMAVPALLYTVINAVAAGGALGGWAVPTATDIAFALAVLGVAGAGAPPALRTFLLTFAVVDDLLAITIIALFYTPSVHPVPLALAVLPLAGFAVLVRRGVRSGWLLLPPAVATWALVYASGVHATVAGVLLAMTVPVVPGVAEHFEHRWRPVSSGLAVPVFAFLAAGVTVAGANPLDPVTVGVVVALVAGKAAGITAVTWLVQRFTAAELAPELSWWDVLGVAVLGGVGFTVSLLIGELAFGAGSARDAQAKLGILAGSLVAALSATVVFRLRRRHYRRQFPQAGRAGDE